MLCPPGGKPVPREKREVKLVAVIPVHGREELIVRTVSRLKRQTFPLFSVVCVGDTESERKAVEDGGGVFFNYKNEPLGDKWQYGINKALEMGGTDILILGSSDWITDTWCENMVKELWNGYDLIGKKDCLFLDIDSNGYKRMCHWPGYLDQPERFFEPIGAGRIISQEILNKTSGLMFYKHLNSSLDWSTYQLVIRNNGCIKTVENDDYPLSLSFYHKWDNKHKWSGIYGVSGLVGSRMFGQEETNNFLKKYFPDAVDLR